MLDSHRLTVLRYIGDVLQPLLRRLERIPKRETLNICRARLRQGPLSLSSVNLILTACLPDSLLLSPLSLFCVCILFPTVHEVVNYTKPTGQITSCFVSIQGHQIQFPYLGRTGWLAGKQGTFVSLLEPVDLNTIAGRRSSMQAGCRWLLTPRFLITARVFFSSQ